MFSNALSITWMGILIICSNCWKTSQIVVGILLDCGDPKGNIGPLYDPCGLFEANKRSSDAGLEAYSLFLPFYPFSIFPLFFIT